MTTESHWYMDGDNITEVPENVVGFVYSILNKPEDRCYVGKKQMLSERKLKPLKGQKRKRKVVKETDWRTYTGTCEPLTAAIERLGKDQFHFEILRFCTSKAEMSYYETKELLVNDALLRHCYYNAKITSVTLSSWNMGVKK